MVVEHKIGGISSREDYIELRNASTDAENVFFSKLQGSLQKNMGGLRLRMRNLVAEFVEEDTIVVSWEEGKAGLQISKGTPAAGSQVEVPALAAGRV